MTMPRRTGERLYDYAPQPVPRERRFTESALDEALDRWLADPSSAQPISVMLKLECSNVVLKVTDPETSSDDRAQRLRGARKSARPRVTTILDSMNDAEAFGPWFPGGRLGTLGEWC